MDIETLLQRSPASLPDPLVRLKSEPREEVDLPYMKPLCSSRDSERRLPPLNFILAERQRPLGLSGPPSPAPSVTHASRTTSSLEPSPKSILKDNLEFESPKTSCIEPRRFSSPCYDRRTDPQYPWLFDRDRFVGQEEERHKSGLTTERKSRQASPDRTGHMPLFTWDSRQPFIASKRVDDDAIANLRRGSEPVYEHQDHRAREESYFDHVFSHSHVAGKTDESSINRHDRVRGQTRSGMNKKGANQKWDAEEDRKIIEMRGNGMKWADISRQLPGRTEIGCRLHYQNYLEKRSEWDDEKKTKLARTYERLKQEIWKPLATELNIPWRSAEAMHWIMGEREMARRANVSDIFSHQMLGASPHFSGDRVYSAAPDGNSVRCEFPAWRCNRKSDAQTDAIYQLDGRTDEREPTSQHSLYDSIALSRESNMRQKHRRNCRSRQSDPPLEDNDGPQFRRDVNAIATDHLKDPRHSITNSVSSIKTAPELPANSSQSRERMHDDARAAKRRRQTVPILRERRQLEIISQNKS